MDRSLIATFVGLLMLTTGLATATADSVAPVGPVANGDFERPFVPNAVPDTLEGTPADECVGIGHQVLFGSAHLQGRLAGDDWQNWGPEDADPNNAFTTLRWLTDRDRPIEHAIGEAEYQSGYGHCVFSTEEGTDQVWFDPVDRTRTPTEWSTGLDSSTEFGSGFDDDPFDREAKILTDSDKAPHNLWQVVNRQQAYTLNFDEYRFTVENWDDIKDNANPLPGNIKLSFTLTPVDTQHPFVLIFLDGFLQFNPGPEDVDDDGVVHLDPVQDGTLKCYWEACDEFKEDYDDGTSEEKRTDLGRLRIIQNSFWTFNQGQEDPVVLDDVAIDGATTTAEEAATGNAKVNPWTPET